MWRIVVAVGLAAFALLGVLGESTRVRAVPEGQWTLAAETDQLRYHVLADETEAPEEVLAAVDRLEEFIDLLAPLWGFAEDRRIDYYRFPSRQAVGELTGVATNGRALAEEGVVHSIQLADAHEVAHVITMKPLPHSGRNVANLWLEGIAMYYTWPSVYYTQEELDEAGMYTEKLGAWHGASVHEQSSRLLEQGKLPALEPLAHGNRVFDRLDTGRTYPAAGSFVTFLIGAAHEDLEALESFRQFVAQADKARAEQATLDAFERAFGRPLSEWEEAWRAFLQSEQATP